MSLRNAIASEIARHGGPYTIRQEVVSPGPNAWTAGSVAAAFSTCKARERKYKPSEISGGIVEGDSLITVDAGSVSVAPKSGDRIAPGEHVADAGAEWRQIVAVYAPAVGGRVAAYKLQVRR